MRAAALALALAALPAPERVLTLDGQTHHVQGIAVDGRALWVTSVDRENRRGLLLRYDLASGREIARIACGEGARFHPGGFDLDAEALWIPVAEYKASSSAWIERRDRNTGVLLARFEVKDHIGAVARLPDRLLGANWDARLFYEWGLDGRLIRVRANPSAWRFQDIKFRGGLLVGAGVAPRGSSDHAIVWLDPETLETKRVVPAGATDRGVPYTNEGLDLEGGRLYLLPEDGPSRLFVFPAEQLLDWKR